MAPRTDLPRFGDVSRSDYLGLVVMWLGRGSFCMVLEDKLNGTIPRLTAGYLHDDPSWERVDDLTSRRK